jgi:hypothetical protein
MRIKTQLWRKKMLTKIALAAALAIGTVGAALASNENDETGGYRQLGPGGVVTDGANPVFHRSMRANNAFGYAPGYTVKHTAR